MLLTAPAIEELQNLEMASLVDMLAEQTGFYTKFIKEVGFTHESETYRQLIVDIQKAIELQRESQQPYKYYQHYQPLYRL